MEMLEGMRYTVNYVMNFRGKVTEPELKSTLKRLDDYIRSEGAEKVGGLISAIRVLYIETKVVDFEVFVPINKAIPSRDDFIYCSGFALSNCILAKYTGASYMMPDAYTRIHYQAESRGLKLKQPFYNVFRNESDVFLSTRTIDVDIYAVVKNIVRREGEY